MRLGAAEARRGVESLDQLYAQAAVVQHMLEVRAARWARALRGCSRPRGNQFRDREDVGSVVMEVNGLKPVDRAIDKAILCYDGDVSRLCDIARVRLVCPSVPALHQCLQRIMVDACVALVLVRNRMDFQETAGDGTGDDGDEETAGWRGVVVRVRLAMEETRRLGCDGHVGEVQLVLQDLQALVTTDSFARYQAFRSIRRDLQTRQWSLRCLGQPSLSFNYDMLPGYDSKEQRIGLVKADLGWVVVGENFQAEGEDNAVLAERSADLPGPPEAHGPAFSFVRLPSCHALASLVLNHLEEDDSEGDEPTATAMTRSTSPTRAASMTRASSLAGRAGAFGRISSALSSGASSSSSISAYREIFRQFNEVRIQPRSSLDASFEDSWQSLIQQQFFRRAMLPGAYLKNKNEAVKAGMARADVSSVFNTATPLEGALSKPIYWLLLICVSLGFFGMGAATTLVAEMFASVGGTPLLRFTALELRGGADPTLYGPGIATLGLLRGGCPVGPMSTQPLNMAGNVSGASVVIGADAAAAADGWFFVTGNATPAYDPVRFQLERWSEKGWQAVGSSSWLLNDLGFVQLLHGWFPTPEERGDMVEFDMRVPWWFGVGPPLSGFLFGLVSLSASICGATGHFRAGVRVFFAAAAMSGVMTSVASIYLFLMGANWEAFYFLGGGILDCLFAIFGVWFQRLFVQGLLICGHLFLLVALTTFFGSGGDWRRLFYVLFGLSGAMIGIAVVIIIFRRRVLRRSLQLVLPDRERYDAMWNRILQTDPSAREAIASLSVLVARIESVIAARSLRPLPRRKAQMLARLIFGRGLRADADIRQGVRRWSTVNGFDAQVVEGNSPSLRLEMPCRERGVIPDHEKLVDKQSPELDLDQLYAQAAGADYLLRAKLLQWIEKSPALLCVDALPCERPVGGRRSQAAAVSDGTVTFLDVQNDHQKSNTDRLGTQTAETLAPGKSDPPKLESSKEKLRFVGIAELEADENILSRVKWARVKKVDRVLEKLIRGYQNDVSKLTDLARQSLYFHSLKDLKECFEIISNDPEIRILRIKNRFDLNFDSIQSAGYRNLAANVLIVSKDAVDLGLDSHVCELQLLLTDFALLKSNNGHKRYVQFRNSRAE